jgi:hypothetical protein
MLGEAHKGRGAKSKTVVAMAVAHRPQSLKMVCGMSFQ